MTEFLFEGELLFKMALPNDTLLHTVHVHVIFTVLFCAI